MRVVVIDDEASARSRMIRLLAAHPEIEIVGEAADGLEALESIQRLSPDLVFLDIQMPGLTGFEVLRSLPTAAPAPLVVFVTGFDQHALEAFEAQALAYLLKPVERDRLSAALDRASRICAYERLRGEEDRKVAQAVEAESIPLRQIVGRKRDKLVLLTPESVLYFTAQGGLIKAKTAGEDFLVNYQLADLEAGLSSANFFRARRSILVNLNCVKEIRPYFKSSFLLVLSDAAQTEITVSERQAKALRMRIPGL